MGGFLGKGRNAESGIIDSIKPATVVTQPVWGHSRSGVLALAFETEVITPFENWLSLATAKVISVEPQASAFTANPESLLPSKASGFSVELWQRQVEQKVISIVGMS